jgi:uncharacterized spore protein YtfJ
MNVQEFLSEAKDAITVKRVFGEPFERDGTTIVPVAAVRGGGGGGGGEGPEGKDSGSGSGFGLTARPVGTYVIRGGQVTWHPSFDVNRAILGGQFVAISLFFALRSISKSRARTKRTRLRSRT